jgi:lipopolysaccharide biosynthesis glycosyltransferase
MKVFVGYDSREDIAYRVCEHSIRARNKEIEVVPLVQSKLRKNGLYNRDIDPLASTEFTFTRFLVPHLMEYQGWAIFCDCDIIFKIDVAEIFAQADDKYAVMVVQHDYTPAEGTKMDNQTQTVYPRKNWSSVILWNCNHPSNAQVNLDLINDPEKTGQFFHRFQWLSDNEIGSLDNSYNWLVGWYKEPHDGTPKVIHYTEGGPWFPNYENCEYGALWERERADYEKTLVPVIPIHPYSTLPPEVNNVIEEMLKYRVDANNEYYETSVDRLIEGVKNLAKKNHLVAVDTGVENVKYDEKGHNYDPFLKNFILGSGGQITVWDKVEQSNTPVVLRGLGKRKQIKHCLEHGRDFYYIDTGYFGNVRKKVYHRITKNALQNIGPIISRPRDRLKMLDWRPTKFRPGKNILLCPPSAKVMAFFELDLDKWMEDTLATLKLYTDRPVIVRLKQGRSVRVTTDTMADALKNDIHCLITFNSIAATEALLLGKPAITLGPNAAQLLCSQSLADVEKPFIPTLDEVEEWAAHLSYCQFTELDMRSGFAWSTLNENSNISSSSTKE